VRVELFNTEKMEKESLKIRSTNALPVNKLYQLEFINRRVEKSAEFYAIYR
jgi:hypothetical protein